MKKFFGSKILAALMLFAVMTAFVATEASAYNVLQIVQRFSATAGETLVTGNVVMIADANGYAYKADANVTTLRPAVGIVGKGATTGHAAEIITIGVLSGWTGLTEGSPGFLSETAGAVTQTEPGYSQKIATAINSTTYAFNFAVQPTIGYYFGGTTNASANTNKRATALFYSGSVDVTSNSVVVSGFSPAFSGTDTYNCIVSAMTNEGAWKCAKTSTSSVTISSGSSATLTDTIDYIVVGY